jgi:hypothetical protein
MKVLLTIQFIFVFLLQSSNAVIVDTNRVYGVTIDGINNLSAIVTSLGNLCKKPTTRIVFDEWVAATSYQNAVNQIHNVSFIMGEILDSYYMSQYTVQQFTDRTNEYVNLLGDKVDIWEIGNEINGEWLGNTSDVVAKMNSAYNIVKAKNYKTELTLYYNYDCWSNPQNEMFRWAQTNISQTMKNGLDYVLISYYEDDCNNYQPNWQRVFDSLHTIFPNAKIGIGECGTTNTANKAAFINRYYKMNITTPKYVGGYFWWYYKQDCVPYTNTLWNTLHTAISNAAAPTVQATNLNYNFITSTKISVNWTNGNGSKRVVFIKDGTSGTPALTGGITYNANINFGQGSSDGSGWYCVYNGATLPGGSLTVQNLTAGHTYRIMTAEYNGNSGFEGYNLNTSTGNPINIIMTGNIGENNLIPMKYELFQNFPNPFNPVTTIRFALGENPDKSGFRSAQQDVKLIIYDNLGKEVLVLVNEALEPGVYEKTFDSSNLSSGIYFYKLIAGQFTDRKTMVLIK